MEKEAKAHLVSRLPNYAGSGPSQLALALLADALGDDEAAIRLYQAFKRKVVSSLPEDHWQMTDEEIREKVRSLSLDFD